MQLFLTSLHKKGFVVNDAPPIPLEFASSSIVSLVPLLLTCLGKKDMSFVSWLIHLLFGSPQGLFKVTMSKFKTEVRKSRGGRVNGLKINLMGQLAVALALINSCSVDDAVRDDIRALVGGDERESSYSAFSAHTPHQALSGIHCSLG